jgi:hypothetical protein
MNSTGAVPGVDYANLNATLARYFENATLVELAKTQAIVVIYKVHLRFWAYTAPDTRKHLRAWASEMSGKAVHNHRMPAQTGEVSVVIMCT